MTAPGRWARDNDEGLHAYVITDYCWGKSDDRIEYASSLADAKREHGSSRMRYTTTTVRRAQPVDVTP